MLGQILNQLAEVESWISEITAGHESHDPTICPMAELYEGFGFMAEDTDDQAIAFIVLAMIDMLRRTKNPAKVGSMIVDKTRQMVAAMAHDRIQARRNAATNAVHDWSNKVNRAYNNPN